MVTRRSVRRALICLVLGAVLTIAVAWGFAFYARVRWSNPLTVGGPYFEQYRPDAWPPLDELQRDGGFGITVKHASGSLDDTILSNSGGIIASVRVVYSISEMQYGFPWRSMSWFETWFSGGIDLNSFPDSPAQYNPEFPVLARGAKAPSWLPHLFGGRTLPLLPMWNGFLYSMILYAVLVWVIWYGLTFSRNRRLLRRQRAQCPNCGYPVGDFAVCPECGNPTGREA